LARHAWLRMPWAHRLRAGVFGAAIALPFAAFEVLLLGAPWPAVRAGVGASVVLLGSAAARRTDGLTTLALGAASCALVDPAATHDLALQLSVTGLAGPILLSRRLALLRLAAFRHGRDRRARPDRLRPLVRRSAALRAPRVPRRPRALGVARDPRRIARSHRARAGGNEHRLPRGRPGRLRRRAASGRTRDADRCRRRSALAGQVRPRSARHRTGAGG